MDLGLEQTDREILADLRGSRTLEVLIRQIEQGKDAVGIELQRACIRGDDKVDGLARTWATYGHVVNLIRGQVETAYKEQQEN